MKKTKLGFVIVALVLTALTGFVLPAAQAAPAAAGISVTPALQDRVLSPTEKKTTFTVSISNHTNKPVTVALSSTDFTALNETGGLAFLGSDAKRVTEGHGLSKFLQLDDETITIPPNESRDVKATIADVSILAPGGHYAAVVAKVIDTQNAGKTGNRVAVQQAVSSLFFLETAGQGTKTMKLLPVPIQKLTFNLPEEVNLVFKATGNTQAIPRGIVTISHGDTIVQRGIINENSSLILPGSTRLLQTPLQGDRHPWLAGTYTLRVQYRYEGSLGVTTYEQRFVYVNVLAALLLTGILVAAIFGLIKLRRLWARRPSEKTNTIKRQLIVVRDDSPDSEEIVVTRSPKADNNTE